MRPLLFKQTRPVSRRSATAAIASRLLRLTLLTARINSPRLGAFRLVFLRVFFMVWWEVSLLSLCLKLGLCHARRIFVLCLIHQTLEGRNLFKKDFII